MILYIIAYNIQQQKINWAINITKGVVNLINLMGSNSVAQTNIHMQNDAKMTNTCT